MLESIVHRHEYKDNTDKAEHKEATEDKSIVSVEYENQTDCTETCEKRDEEVGKKYNGLCNRFDVEELKSGYNCLELISFYHEYKPSIEIFNVNPDVDGDAGG